MDTSYNYKAYCSRPTTEYTDYRYCSNQYKVVHLHVYVLQYCTVVDWTKCAIVVDCTVVDWILTLSLICDPLAGIISH